VAFSRSLNGKKTSRSTQKRPTDVQSHHLQQDGRPRLARNHVINPVPASRTLLDAQLWMVCLAPMPRNGVLVFRVFLQRCTASKQSREYPKSQKICPSCGRHQYIYTPRKSRKHVPMPHHRHCFFLGSATHAKSFLGHDRRLNSKGYKLATSPCSCSPDSLED
jgi:hypothetical protein